MKKLENINRTLENVASEEVRVQAENWILRKAYQLNRADILKQIERIKFTKDDEGNRVERTLTEEEEDSVAILQAEAAEYTTAIEDKDALLADFEPTPSDVRKMRLIAYGNRDEHAELNVRFGQPILKSGDTKMEALLGWKMLCNNMEHFKAVQAENNESSKAYKQAFDALSRSVRAFMGWNYETNNESESVCDHTVVFADGIHWNWDKSTNFVKFIASLACYELKYVKGECVQTFSAKIFWNSICTYLYVALTKGNKFGMKYTAPAIIPVPVNPTGLVEEEKSKETTQAESVSESDTEDTQGATPAKKAPAAAKKTA